MEVLLDQSLVSLEWLQKEQPLISGRGYSLAKWNDLDAREVLLAAFVDSHLRSVPTFFSEPDFGKPDSILLTFC